MKQVRVLTANEHEYFITHFFSLTLSFQGIPPSESFDLL